MWRYLAGAGAALALAGAGVLVFSGHATPHPLLPAAPPTAGSAVGVQETLPDSVPEASARTREEKRFGRYDKDRDGTITRPEYFAARHKAFAKLDTNGDGQLSFDEWSVKAIAKFTGADADKSGSLSAAEFATTAVKRKTKARAKCPPGGATPARDDGERDD